MTALAFTPADAPTLHDALAAAPDGSTVTLAGGVYALRSTIILQRSLTLVGAGDGEVVLDGMQRRSIMQLFGEKLRYEIRGVTFANGAGDNAGAIASPNANTVRIEGCAFRENHATRNGSAILLRTGTATLERCIFDRNVTTKGGGIDIGLGQTSTLDRCVFIENEADVGAGVFLNDRSSCIMKSCTFFGNRATRRRGGGAVFVFGTGTHGPQLEIVNSIFVGEETIHSDPSKKYEVRVTHSIVPHDLFSQPSFKDMGHNTLGIPKIATVGPRLWALTADAPGAGTADVARIAAGAVDALGRPLVVDGKADPGALARPRP